MVPPTINCALYVLYRVASVRENQGESESFKVTFSNQGKSGKIYLFEENQGKIREFLYESGKKGNFVIVFICYFLDLSKKIVIFWDLSKTFRSRLRRLHAINIF